MNPNIQFPLPENNQLEFHASCSEGLDEFLVEEISKYSLKIIAKNRGGVHFSGPTSEILKFILRTRFSSRVAVTLFRTRVNSADDLYTRSLQFPWETIIEPEDSFRIDAMTKDILGNSRYAMYRLKDSIRDRLRKKEDREGEIEKNHPDVNIVLRSFQETAIVQLNLSSLPLHKRGYRTEISEAPLREVLAQALLAFADWKEDELLLDPMCGSGTILIEAALRLKYKNQINVPLLTESPVFLRLFSSESLRDEPGPSPVNKTIFGFDTNEKAIRSARINARKAGVENFISFEQSDFRFLHKKQNFQNIKIITNPPYGERIGEKSEIKDLYTEIGKVLKDNYGGSSFHLICGDKSLLGYFRLKADKEKSVTISNLKGKFVSYSIK